METTQLQVYEPYTDIRAELAKLAEENDKAVFDYESPSGQKMARSHIHNIRLVKLGHGVHNVNYATAALHVAIDNAQEARKILGFGAGP